ncbi:MAG TPA: DivIVA domain-containing protein [Solirubrobacteraceae bacterium]|jgi:DivIVA domain-containing protein|nr:DivIVA domain-containing protein [Solirubrobacteraceae bacterium]
MSEELMRSGEDLFKPSRRGYDREEVDAYVAQLHRQIRELQVQQQTPDAAVRSALERVGDEVADILKQTHNTSDEIVATAQREADAHREEAARQAAHVTAVAEQRVHELDLDTDRIWGERERIVADARDLARQLTQLADLAAERFPQDSQQNAGGQQRGMGYGDDRVSGFDELNAGH